MTKKEAIKLFEERKVRTVWDDELEKVLSIVDVIGVLTDSPDPRNYWKVLKNRLKKEGNETVTNCNQLKLVAEDGKKLSYRCCRYRTTFPHDSIRPFSQSRTF